MLEYDHSDLIAHSRLSPWREGTGPTYQPCPLSSEYSFLASLDVLSDQWHQSSLDGWVAPYLHSHPAFWDAIGCQVTGVVCGGEQRGTQPAVGELLHQSAPAATYQDSGRNRQVSSPQGQLAEGVGPEQSPAPLWGK